jgi:hypothetical protein
MYVGTKADNPAHSIEALLHMQKMRKCVRPPLPLDWQLHWLKKLLPLLPLPSNTGSLSHL